MGRQAAYKKVWKAIIRLAYASFFGVSVSEATIISLGSPARFGAGAGSEEDLEEYLKLVSPLPSQNQAFCRSRFPPFDQSQKYHQSPILHYFLLLQVKLLRKILPSVPFSSGSSLSSPLVS